MHEEDLIIAGQRYALDPTHESHGETCDHYSSSSVHIRAKRQHHEPDPQPRIEETPEEPFDLNPWNHLNDTEPIVDEETVTKINATDPSTLNPLVNPVNLTPNPLELPEKEPDHGWVEEEILVPTPPKPTEPVDKKDSETPPAK